MCVIAPDVGEIRVVVGQTPTLLEEQLCPALEEARRPAVVQEGIQFDADPFQSLVMSDALSTSKIH